MNCLYLLCSNCYVLLAKVRLTQLRTRFKEMAQDKRETLYTPHSSSTQTSNLSKAWNISTSTQILDQVYVVFLSVGWKWISAAIINTFGFSKC